MTQPGMPDIPYNLAKYGFKDLETLWITNGGNPVYAPMAAAVAMAESGGNPKSENHNQNGTTDRGLWQINSIHGSLSTFDPVSNVKAAIQLSSGGTNWRPWCTAYDDGSCGSSGGSFLGPNSPFRKFLPSGATTGGTGYGATPDGGGSILDPNTWAKAILTPIGVWAWYGLMLVGGSIIIVWGIILLVLNSKPARTAANVGIDVGTGGSARSVRALARQARRKQLAEKSKVDD